MKMSKVLSLDIETKNLSNEIGGWHNQHMFKVACAVTWDGKKGVVYTDAPLTDTLTKSEGLEFKELRQLKFDLDDHFQKGGRILGHNINAFDLPVLRDSHTDIFIVRKYLDDKETRCIDTSAYITKHSGKRVHLDNLVKCTLNESKLMEATYSVELWKMGEYDDVIEYCLKDTQLTYDLWKYGQDNGIVKYYDSDEKCYVEIKTDW
tara:strand:- start:1167 stop:1784 length:618 start_codon:yes stop_codon:yes gene_type:complete